MVLEIPDLVPSSVARKHSVLALNGVVLTFRNKCRWNQTVQNDGNDLTLERWSFGWID